MIHLIAQQTPPHHAWLPVAVLIVIALIFAVASLTMSAIIGPSRSGSVKAGTYESGMVPIGDTRKRFNVRFYIVAMIFLVFDVEIVFFYPWASIFAPTVQSDPALSNVLLIEMLLFVAILLVAYLYAWGKGVFRWD